MNQRSIMLSAIDSMPFFSTAAMRPFQISAVPILWAVFESTILRTSSGFLSIERLDDLAADGEADRTPPS